MGKTKRFEIGDIVQPRTKNFEGLLLILSNEELWDDAVYISGENDGKRRHIHKKGAFMKVGSILKK